MPSKLLLITAGTVAAGVGQEFLKQITTHAVTDLEVKVCYMDTSWLPDTYPDIQVGEWFHLNVDARHMNFTNKNLDQNPRLKKLLYPGLLPQTDGTGGGSIRYNAAGAVEVARTEIKAWIKKGMDDLSKSGDRQTKLAVALVISAVGATGSGSLEHLIEIVVEAAHDANVPTPIRCDVFILQPGAQGMTPLLLANTLALYAEMAASRLSRSRSASKLYQGRTIMVGWGDTYTLTSLEQLQETAAALIRLTKDTVAGVAAHHQGRQIDKHVLREEDSQTGLPSHLSSATPITISLGDLTTQILEADVARIVSDLVLGTGTAINDQEHVNVLHGPVNFLKGDNPSLSYGLLLNRILEGIQLKSLTMITLVTMSRVPAREQSTRLKQFWNGDKDELTQQGRPKIQKAAAQLALDATNEMKQIRENRMAANYSLVRLFEDYQEISRSVSILLKEAMNYTPQAGASEHTVLQLLVDLDHANILNRQAALTKAIAAIHSHLRSQLEREAHIVATKVLSAIEKHCQDALRGIGALIQATRRERDAQPGWGTDHPPLAVHIDHPLHLPAISDPNDLQLYYDKVSLFTTQINDEEAIITSILTDAATLDPLAEFRQWLKDKNYGDVLFAGNFSRLKDVARQYAQQQLQNKIAGYSVIDVLLQVGDDTLQKRVAEAAKHAQSLVPFSEKFAPDRSESRYVSACYKDEQRTPLETALRKAFGQGEWTLFRSNDPTEIVVFYYIDGLPISAVKDLMGRCLEEFLHRRKLWHRRDKSFTQKVGVPIYSGRDTEKLVHETGVIRKLYEVKGDNVGEYTEADVPELGEYKGDIEDSVDVDASHAPQNNKNGTHRDSQPTARKSRKSS